MIDAGLGLGILFAFVRALQWAPMPDTERMMESIRSVDILHPVIVNETPLRCGDRLTGLTDARFSGRIYAMDIDADLLHFTLRMQGGSGDADLYVRPAAPPTLRDYTQRPFVRGNEESIRVNSPSAGRWYVLVHGYDNYEGVTLQLECLPRPKDGERLELVGSRDLELALYYELSGVAATNQVWSAELRNQALREEGRTAFTAGAYDKAIETWGRWAELDRDNPEPVALVGDIYLRQGRMSDAVAQYQKSLAIQPGQIGLMVRLARLIDLQLGQAAESREILNQYAKLFPQQNDVALAQAEWLFRRRRYKEAGHIIRSVIATESDNLGALTLLHSLLPTPAERFDNMRAMLEVGRRPGRAMQLAQAVLDLNLLTRPESWMLMDFFQEMSETAPTEAQREVFARLLPREQATVEDFRVGRMSRNWLSSRDQAWGGQGSLTLSADPTQSEAFLRLLGSDAMHNGFMEAVVEDTRGFFWLYARRGEGNMIRFGFEENGQVYLQIWMNNQLLTNLSRVWSRPPGPFTFRLETRADGAYAYIDGRPAFSSPASIPRDMGLGWWGLAPWSPQLGTAAVTVRRVAGGPTPVLLGQLRYHNEIPRSPEQLADLERHIRTLSALAPDWYEQTPDGRVLRTLHSRDMELRLLCRYHRTRLLPALRVHSLDRLDLPALLASAGKDRVDGFTMFVRRMPDPAWFVEAEQAVLQAGVTLHVALEDSARQTVILRELTPGVGLFPGPRRAHELPLIFPDAKERFQDMDTPRDLYFIL